MAMVAATVAAAARHTLSEYHGCRLADQLPTQPGCGELLLTDVFVGHDRGFNPLYDTALLCCDYRTPGPRPLDGDHADCYMPVTGVRKDQLHTVCDTLVVYSGGGGGGLPMVWCRIVEPLPLPIDPYRDNYNLGD